MTAQRLEQPEYCQSCAGGAVSLDLDAELEETIALFARHFEFKDRRRARSFAGLLLTAIEGGYIRGRAEHSSQGFKEAAAWLAELADASGR